MKKGSPYKVNVLIDTNIYFSDFYRKGPEFRGLMHMLKISGSTLLIPRVVEKEVIKKFTEQAKIDMSKIKRTAGKYPEAVKIKMSAKKIIEDFEKTWNGINKYNGEIRIIEHESIKLDKIVDRAISERAPFGKKDKGFRDAVIWESAIDYLENCSNKDPLVIITKNTDDFGSNKLDPLLKDEVAKTGRTAYYYQDIGTFLKVHGKQLDFLSDDTVKEWVDDNKSQLENSLDDPYELKQLIEPSELAYDDVSDLNVDRATLQDYWVYTYYVSDEDDNFLYVDVQVSLAVELEISFMYLLPIWQRRDTLDYQSGYEYVQADLDHIMEFKVNKKTHKVEII
jgi:hypothetical protein